MSNKRSDRIPADQLTAYERWELPAMEAGGNDVLRTRVTSAEIPIKPLTAADLENIQKEAYQAGFDQGKEEGVSAGHKEGFDKGLKEGLDSGTQQGMQQGKITGQEQKQAECDENIARLKSVMEHLVDPIRLHDEEIEEALLNLTLAISRSVIQRELSIDSRQIVGVVSDAIAMLPPPAMNVKVWINPVDFECVSDVIEQIATGAKIIKSDEVLPGGCKVETLHSLIDSTIEKRFQKTVQQMLDRHTSTLPQEDVPDLTESMDDMTDFHRDILEEPIIDASSVKAEVALESDVAPELELELELEPEPEPELEPELEPDLTPEELTPPETAEALPLEDVISKDAEIEESNSKDSLLEETEPKNKSIEDVNLESSVSDDAVAKIIDTPDEPS